MKIVIRKSRNGEFYYVIKAKNNQVLATSETYKRHSDAVRGACRFEEAAHDGFSIITK